VYARRTPRPKAVGYLIPTANKLRLEQAECINHFAVGCSSRSQKNSITEVTTQQERADMEPDQRNPTGRTHGPLSRQALTSSWLMRSVALGATSAGVETFAGAGLPHWLEARGYGSRSLNRPRTHYARLAPVRPKLLGRYPVHKGSFSQSRPLSSPLKVSRGAWFTGWSASRVYWDAIPLLKWVGIPCIVGRHPVA